MNLYPEKNPEDAEAPYTMYPTPGLSAIGSPPLAAGWRGLYPATNGKLYGVCGLNVYYIDPDYNTTLLGALSEARSNPVSMVDNGITLALVDGSAMGYQITLADNTFGNITDADFYGATRADYLDTFLLFNRPNTQQFYSSLSNSLDFDPTYLAAKTGFPDKLSTLIVMHREIWLLGAQYTSEVWYNAGSAAFPFQITQGVFIEHGCIAPYSVAKHDLVIFWLSVDAAGQATVLQGANYTAKKISTPAIAAQFSQYARIDDAIGMIYKQQDHIFYMLTFPTADKTWVYDMSEGLWHQRSSMDINGVEHRHRANCCAFAYGKNIVGDYINGQLYIFDLNNFTDNSVPILRRRGLRHLVDDGNRVTYRSASADIQCGEEFHSEQVGPAFSSGFSSAFGPQGTIAMDQIYLRWSDDRGNSYGNPVSQSLGDSGGYLIQPQWNQLGMARDRVFEVYWATPVMTAFQGMWIDATPAGT